MKKNIGRKSSDGINRLSKTKRTRSVPRSFNSERGDKKKVYDTQSLNPIKKRIKNSEIRTSLQKKIIPILGDFSREKIPELTLKKSFYTPPRYTNTSKNFATKIIKFITTHKFFFGHVARIGLVFGTLFFLLNQNHTAIGYIEPHLAYQEIDESIILKKSPNESELGFDIIAISDKESLSIIANSKEMVEEKSFGVVTVFNNFSTEPQRLRPNTRFTSASGKIFILGDNEIIIPGKEGDIPGKINISIYAQNSGEEYNLGITDFTLPGYKESGSDDRYNMIYAVSETAFEGGFRGEKSIITSEQKRQAEIELRDKLQERLVLRLQKEKTEQVIIINNTSAINFQDSEALFNDQGREGVITQKGTIFAMVISRDQLMNFIDNSYLTVPEGEEVHVIDLLNFKIKYTGTTPINFQKTETLRVEITGESLLQWAIDYTNVRNEIKGKTNKELLSYLQNNNALDKAYFKNIPFWHHTLPKDIIDIEIDKQ
jgi:hypothetical protein